MDDHEPSDIGTNIAHDGPGRPLPPPPTFGELVAIARQRFGLRHPGLDPMRLLLTAAACLGLGGMAWMTLLSKPAPSPVVAPITVTHPTTVAPNTLRSTTTATVQEVVIDVAGAVADPGPVRLRGTPRVIDAITAAGGTTPGADLERVDRAAIVRDGDRVYVPHFGQQDIPVVVGQSTAGESTPAGTPTGSESASTMAGPVNLNTADATKLEALPGIGPATAQAILAYRNAHGPFRTVDDLLNIKGIGPAKMATLRPHVMV